MDPPPDYARPSAFVRQSPDYGGQDVADEQELVPTELKRSARRWPLRSMIGST